MLIWFIGFVLYRILMQIDTPIGNTLPDMLLTIGICLLAGKARKKKEVLHVQYQS
jgi:hypothetical protein